MYFLQKLIFGHFEVWKDLEEKHRFFKEKLEKFTDIRDLKKMLQ